MAGGAYYWFIAHPGYAPKVNSYGNLYNRLIADSAQHIPNKSCLCTNDNDTTPQLFIYADTLRGFWNGTFKNIGFGSGGGSGIDTIFVTSIGTGSPQVQLLYAVNGNLRSARLVKGLFTTPVMNLDSGVRIDLDTAGSAGIAYKLWIIAQYGPPTGFGGGTLQQVITINDTLRKDDTIEFNQNKLLFHSSGAFNEFQIQNINGSNQTNFEIFPTELQSVTSDGTNIGSLNITSTTALFGTFNFGAGKYGQYLSSLDSVAMSAVNGGNSCTFSLTPTTARLKGLPNKTAGATDSALLVDITGNVFKAPGGGGGGAAFTRQSITSGTSGTVTGGKYIVTFNPSSFIAAYTLTLPASPADMDEVEIEAGGTITGGATVVASLIISPNSGQTIHQKVTPTTIDDGETIKYRYRTANTAWYRKL